MSIESNYVDIVEILLEFFKENQLNKYDNKSIEYYNLKTQLIEVINIAINEVDLSSEMKKILSPYINFEGSDDEYDLSDLPGQNKLNAIENANNKIKALKDTYNQYILPSGFIANINEIPSISIPPINVAEIKLQLIYNKDVLEHYNSPNLNVALEIKQIDNLVGDIEQIEGTI